MRRSSSLWSWFLLASPMILACTGSKDAPGTGGADAAAPDAAGPYPKDGTLRVNQLQLLATHNSYHVEKEGNAIPDWKYTRDPLETQLGSQGVRGVELDTHYAEATRSIDVFHVPTLDDGTTCSRFVDCLGELLSWSDANPKHHLLFVQIEPKEPSLNQVVDFAAYSDELDAEILSVWPRERVVTPEDVQGGAATLREAVTTEGWPTIGATRGKVLFYANDRTTFHDAYTRGGSDIQGRVLFPESKPDEPIAGIVILNTPDPSNADVVRQGFIVRSMVDGVPIRADHATVRETALLSGAHILSTDYPVPAGDVEAFLLPGGTPSRCNPVTAPEGCTSADIESPAHLSQ